MDSSPQPPLPRSPRLRADPTRYAGITASAPWFAGLLVGIAIAGNLVAEAFAGAAQLPDLPEPSAAVRYAIGVFRVLLDVSIVAAMGLALLAKFLGFDEPARTEPVMRRARRYAVWFSWAWVASALISIVWLAAEVYPDEFPRRTSGFLDLLTSPLSFLQFLLTSPDLIWDYIRGVPAGKGLLVTAALGLFSVWMCRISVRRGEAVPAELRAGIAAFALLPLPLTGHASPWKYHDLVMISMELHVTAAAAWAGGLGACILMLARRPALLAIALPRYSRLATWCVFIVAASGLFSAIAMLATATGTVMPDAIWTTDYGLLALAKVACIVAVGLVAVTVRRGMLGRIADQKPTAVALWCGVELMVMALAYGIAVILTRSAPF